MAPLLQVKRLGKRYGATWVVRDLSFEVMPGEVLGVLGPNGAGKTTLLECIAGLRAADEGEARVAGIDVATQRVRVQRRLGLALQQTAVPPQATVREALLLQAAFFPPVSRAAVSAALQDFGLVEVAGQRFDTLSLGQRQRLGLALSALHQPQVWLLDEPGAALDNASRHRIRRLLQAQCERGGAAVMATHDWPEAEAICTRVAIMQGGTFRAMGPDELAAATQAPARVRLVTSRPLLPADAAQWPGVLSVTSQGMALLLRTSDPTTTTAALVRFLQLQRVEIVELEVKAATLQEALADAPALRTAEERGA